MATPFTAHHAKPGRRRAPTKGLGRRLLAAITALIAFAFLSVAPASAALVLPTPKDYVSNLDLECFKTNPYQPPTTSLTLRHLNPVITGVPPITVTLGIREQLCVPVAKNSVFPPPAVLDFIRYTDLACYKVSGPALNRALVLNHLNPLLSSLPRQEFLVGAPQQLCVPVIKNNALPSDEVLSVVRHVDLLCYAVTPPNPLNRTLTLTQLNPVLTQIPTRPVSVGAARQLCLPVAKGGDNIPAAVLAIVRWVDLLKYDVAATSAIPPLGLSIRHINPVLGHLPPESVALSNTSQLGLPVAKNNTIPPG
ncbi:hypothetical protein [Rhizohabitans arisaemae]|uniref:hypothetical protein n=1 Tax=Rhizohabitans arisaemae TaxID=2720610 RepID=UPI0024B09971|nr:hypothetical protein [Rhizohabitans arisaemae]